MVVISNFVNRRFHITYDLTGLKIVVDSANGAAYSVGPTVYRELGAQSHCPL